MTTDDTITAGLVNANQPAFKLVQAPFSEEPYGVGLKKGDQAFRAFLNDRLEAIYGDGGWAAAFASTLGRLGLKSEPPKVDRYTATAAAAAGAVTTTTTVAGGTTSTTVATNTSAPHP